MEFKERIAAADALLIATPEYNYSIPGVLKNALDWASRPPGQSPLIGKPLAFMGASTGYFGTSRAQYHLRQVCVILNMHPVNSPEVFISGAASKFDESGRLTDTMFRNGISKLLEALQEWTIRLTGGLIPDHGFGKNFDDSYPEIRFTAEHQANLRKSSNRTLLG